LNWLAAKLPLESLRATLEGMGDTLPLLPKAACPTAVSIANRLAILDGDALWSNSKLRSGVLNGRVDTLVVIIPGVVMRYSDIRMSPVINLY